MLSFQYKILERLVMIDHVEQVTGSLPYKTLKSNELSPVFYEAVQEYHDVLADGNLDVLLAFVVSEESALKVADNVYQLAVKLNNGKEPSSLDVLPLDLHDSFTKAQRDFILMRELPAAGSKRRKVYDDVLRSFRTTVSDLVAGAYGLPSSADYKDETTISRLFEFTGLTGEEARKKTRMLTFIKRISNIALIVAGIAGFVSIFVFLQFWLGALMFSTFGLVGLLVSMIFITTEVEAELNSKNYVSNTFRLFKKRFDSMSEQYGTFIKPYLASMESYLLQEK